MRNQISIELLSHPNIRSIAASLSLVRIKYKTVAAQLATVYAQHIITMQFMYTTYTHALYIHTYV